MGQAKRPTCPSCGAFLILALPPGGEGPRTFQCFDCDRPDPMKTDEATGWLSGELALQLPFRFEVGSLSDHLMSSAPE